MDSYGARQYEYEYGVVPLRECPSSDQADECALRLTLCRTQSL